MLISIKKVLRLKGALLSSEGSPEVFGALVGTFTGGVDRHDVNGINLALILL